MTADESFDAFVLAHGPELLAFARRLTLDHHRAEDIVQDVLARVCLSWPLDVTDPRPYLVRAVLRQFLSWRRRLSSGEHPVRDPEGARDPGFADALVERDRVRRALRALPPVQRAVLVLRYFLDRPDSEIAALLGCRESTVRSHARRALTRLRGVGELAAAYEGTPP